MKKQFYPLIFGIFCLNQLSAQYYPSSPRKNNDIETLEKLSNMMERDKNNELHAKQAVLGYRSEVRNEMRLISRFLTEEQLKSMINREKFYWEIYTQALQYSRSYLDFYQKYYENLEKYKENMFDYLEEIIK